jgi:hypothetical protein
MARAFLREDHRYVAVLDTGERAMIASLMEQTRLILSPEVEATGDAFDDLVASMGVSLAADEAPGELDDEDSEDLTYRDPALDRLLPTAHRGDDQVAAEFRRLTEEGLRQRKSANLDTALDSLEAVGGEGRLELDDAEAPAFLMALTDVRLLLGERMGMRTEEDAEALHEAMETIADDDPIGYAMAVYDFLTWLQETLTHALMGPDPTGLTDQASEDEGGAGPLDTGSEESL